MVDKAKQEEIWRTYPEYDFIEVSNLGRIRIKDRMVTRSSKGDFYVKGRILKQYDNGRGYMSVHFNFNRQTVHLYVHRATAICFIPNPDNLPEVNHKDNNKTNNVASNLEWCTPGYNIAYREKYGTPAKEATRVLRKPVIAVNSDTGDVFWFQSQHEASRQLGISQGNINNVIKNKYNKTSGYWFCDANEDAIEKTRIKFGDKIARKVEELMRQNKN